MTRSPDVPSVTTKTIPAGHGEITCILLPDEPNAPPIVWPPSSREIARRKAKAEAAARDAEAARALQMQVQRGFRPPRGKAFGVDTAGLLLIGPAGAIGTSAVMARTLAPLAAGGRHPVGAMMAAGAWKDEAALREALAGLGPKLHAIGLRVCYRRAGLRVAKLKPEQDARPAASAEPACR